MTHMGLDSESQTIYCPTCNSENRFSARFCRRCGGVLFHDQSGTSHEAITLDHEPMADEPLMLETKDSINSLDATSESTEIDTLLSGSESESIYSKENTLTDGISSGEIEPHLQEIPRSILAQIESIETDQSEASPNLLLQKDDSPIIAHIDIGTFVADRYLVIEVVEADGNSLAYKVEDHGVCRSCEAEIDNNEETYCFNCGAQLHDGGATWPKLVLISLQGAPDIPSSKSVFWSNQWFEVVPGDSKAGHLDAYVHKDQSVGLSLLASQLSDVGILRAGKPDEDSLVSFSYSYIADSNVATGVGLYLVADGMGGHGDGEIASQLAAQVVSNNLLQSVVLPIIQGQTLLPMSIRAQIDGAIQTANKHVMEAARERGNDMGTTLVLALIVNGVAYVGNVGDSRAYLWGTDGLQQITEDHSTVFSLYKAGTIEESEIYTHPRRSEIFRSLGNKVNVEVDQFEVSLRSEYWLILCCDGLWEMLHSEGIADSLMLGMTDPQAVCQNLVRKANQAGGEDNISVIAVRAIR